MRFSEAKGRKVVSTSTADTVGKVERFVVDPETRKIVALELKKTSDAHALPWADIISFGADAVTVSDEGKLADHDDHVAPLAAKELRILGRRVLSDTGDEWGKVKDVDFDPATGSVTSLLLEDGNIPEVAGRRMIGIGSYAVIVTAEDPPA